MLCNVYKIRYLWNATGVTLPFISYGGSSLLVSMASIGIILNVSKNIWLIHEYMFDIILLGGFGMNNIILNDDYKIEDMIYEIRGKQVMLDSDLAKLYKCVNGTKTINLAVKRHINRFPERFMFQLTDDEYNDLRFQTETSNLENDYGGRRYNPYVFTEQGVAMLATVLKT